jgi:tol-pal system protein YbgF
MSNSEAVNYQRGAPERAAHMHRLRAASSLFDGGANWVVLASAVLALAGCATKGDLRDLRTEVVAIQTRQDSLFRIMQRQNREILDSLHAGSELMVRVRGDLGHRLLELEQQLVQIQELTGQSQTRIQQLKEQLEQRAEQQAAAAAAAASPQGLPGGVPGASPPAEELYRAGSEQLQRGAASTARQAFEQLLRDYPTDERAPDAQFSLAETFVVEKQLDRALEEFDRVVELFPSSTQAPTALYRAGVVSEERGNVQKARTYYQRVSARYPRSDEARLASDKLRRLR